MNEMYYFGCWAESGHGLYRPDGYEISPHRQPHPTPLTANDIDSVFAPRGTTDAKHVELTHIHGWTVLAMWDYSVDRRPNSNAAFLLRGRHSEYEMWREAELQFPAIVRRLEAYAVFKATDDETRCAVCGWKLADSIAGGCVRGNCSMRPFPSRYYSPERAAKEYAPTALPPSDNYQPPRTSGTFTGETGELVR